MSEQLDRQIARFLLDLLPPGRPRRLARMSFPGELLRDGTPRDKYQDIKDKQLTLAMLAEHVRGRKTYSYTLDKDDKAREGAIDIDAGGQPALLAALRVAAELGITAFAVENDAGGKHKGGHFRALFDASYPVAHIRALMLTIAEQAGLGAVEIWPQNQGLRGLFGFHQVDQTRGQLLLQSGEIIKLDDDLAAGFAAVRALPLNSAPPAPPEPEPAPAPARPAAAQNISQAQPRQQAGRASLDDVRKEFNAQHPLEQLLLGYGAQRTKDGYTCPFCTHSHQTTLYISRQGKLFSFSPNCRLHTSKGYDAFGLYVLLEHNNNVISAAKALNPIEPRKRQAEQPPLVEQMQRQRTPAQVADAERKREARAATAAEIRASVEQRAQQDERLTPCDRATLGAMLAWAAEKHSACCWLGRAALAARSGYSLGSVKRSVMELEKLGYFESSGAGGRPIDTAHRTFTCGSSLQPETIFVANDDPRKILEASDLDQTLGASERAPLPQPPAPAVDRALLGYVRALAKEAAEPGWALREYDALDQAQLEQEAARLEQHLVEPAQEVADGEYLASYSPPAVEPSGVYTGRVKDFQSFAEQWAVATSAIRTRSDVDEPTPAEQQPLDEALPSAPSLQACPPAPSDPRYGDFAWRWQAAQPGSIDKRTSKPRTDAQRARFKRQALELCDYAEPSEAARRWLAFKRPTAPSSSPGLGVRARAGAPRARASQAQRPQAAPNLFAGQASLFDAPRGVAAD